MGSHLHSVTSEAQTSFECASNNALVPWLDKQLIYLLWKKFLQQHTSRSVVISDAASQPSRLQFNIESAQHETKRAHTVQMSGFPNSDTVAVWLGGSATTTTMVKATTKKGRHGSGSVSHTLDCLSSYWHNFFSLYSDFIQVSPQKEAHLSITPP